MKRRLIILVALLFVVTAASAASIWTIPVQDAPEDNVFTRYDSALGICGDFNLSSVACLQYQHWINHKFGYCISAGATYEPNPAGYKPEFEFAGFGQLAKAVYTASSPYLDTRLYTWVMVGFDVEQNRRCNDDLVKTNGSFTAGIGLDVTSLSHISIPMEFGYSIQGPETFQIVGTGQLGIRYRY